MATWTRDEEKVFENAIALHWIDEDSKEQWEKISSLVPSKSLEELKLHYKILVEDVCAIEAGNVTIPNYEGEEASSSTRDLPGTMATDKKMNCGYGSGFIESSQESSGDGGKGESRSEQERRKGIPWTEEEHRLFILGLDKCGKGDWRSISRNFVISRTPTQVASHAQKYFIRLNSMNRDRRRSSIHDITRQVNTNPAAAPAPAKGPPLKHSAQPHMPGLPMYGHPVGPLVGHVASAVGTPVMLPPLRHHPNSPYVAYPMAPPQTISHLLKISPEDTR
ncbi:transcription factor MYBS [Salix suchowensis]|nr:transcription factor MYBS [Salix suchowensis]